jgi:hypothetical protein
MATRAVTRPIYTGPVRRIRSQFGEGENFRSFEKYMDRGSSKKVFSFAPCVSRPTDVVKAPKSISECIEFVRYRSRQTVKYQSLVQDLQMHVFRGEEPSRETTCVKPNFYPWHWKAVEGFSKRRDYQYDSKTNKTSIKDARNCLMPFATDSS